MRYVLAAGVSLLSCQASYATENVCLIRAGSQLQAMSGNQKYLTSEEILRSIVANCKENQIVTIFGPREVIKEADSFCDFSKQIVVSKDGNLMSCVFVGARQRSEIHDVAP